MTEQSTTDGMRGLAAGIDKLLNPSMGKKTNGFVLLVFPFEGDDQAMLGGKVNYVSNCQRQEMVIALKEIVARFEGGTGMGKEIQR